MVKHLLGLLLLLFVMASCSSDQYLIDGMSSVHGLEGEILYLKVIKDGAPVVIDSSQVSHGRFRFSGIADSAMMAFLFQGENNVMPLVLENANVTMRIEEARLSTTGTPLNDTLSCFIQRKTQLDACIAELPRKETQMIMNGVSQDVIDEKLGMEARALSVRNDRLITSFITSNYNNVLGPGVFMLMTSGFRVPVINPQIESLLMDAPPYFLNHPYVKEYVRVARSHSEETE